MPTEFDPTLLSHPLQMGGIRLATMDEPMEGGRPGCRVALIDTGSGLRFTVAVDHGGDIVDATYNDCSLTFLSPNGMTRPQEANHLDMRWLRGWTGGLLTTCGPLHIGAPRPNTPTAEGLHGHQHHTPASLRAVEQPDPALGQYDMVLRMVIRDTKMFGPIIETRRTIRCRLGEPGITIEDEVTNRGNDTAPHLWLYHVNFGHPLLEPGARVVCKGKLSRAWGTIDASEVAGMKTIGPPRADHCGAGEGGFIAALDADGQGRCTVGLANQQRQLGVRMRFDQTALPHLAVWQHLASGSYVCGVEPFYGALLRDENTVDPQLEPGESRRYQLHIEVMRGQEEVRGLLAADGPVSA